MKALFNAQLCNIVHAFKALTTHRRFALHSVALEVNDIHSYPTEPFVGQSWP